MPTSCHETLIEMFRQRPALAPELLREAFEIPLPEHHQIQLGAADLPDLRPTEYRADAVVVLAEDDEPVLAVVLEVQASRDPVKRFTWPVYLTTLRARLRCPTVLLTVSTDAKVASWCAAPIPLGHPDWILKPLVLGPDRVPLVTDLVEALRNPQMTVLSALAHPEDEATLPALISAFEALDYDHVALYSDLVLAALPAELKLKLEELMTTHHPYLSDFAGKYYLRGAAETKAEDVLTVLRERGIPVTDAPMLQIVRCTDIEQLNLWLRRSATAANVDELFAANSDGLIE